MYGVIDFSLIDTMPGGTGAFAPPAGWQGDYRQFLLARFKGDCGACLLYTSPSPRDRQKSRMPSSA